MNCQQIQHLIHAHHDGELDAAHAAEMEDHLASCPRCTATAWNLTNLRDVLSKGELSYQAPAALRQRIRGEIRQAAAAERASAFGRWPWRNLGLAAALVMVAAVLALQFYHPRREDRLLAELTSSHVRSLMADHLTDVASSDRHTVKPWFDGKLNYAAPVLDLSAAGFPLVGGRLDLVDERPVAALVYARQKHLINLFVWPAESPAELPPRIAGHNGYNLVQWTSQRMVFWAVSDLNAKELQEFAKNVTAAEPAMPLP